MAQLAEQAHWATQRQLLQLQLEEQQLEHRHALTTGGGGGGTTRSTSINPLGASEAGAAAVAAAAAAAAAAKGAYAGTASSTAGLASSSHAPSVLSPPGSQALQVTPDELQEIMSVVQALAGGCACVSSSGVAGHQGVRLRSSVLDSVTAPALFIC
jgi:hypothetical protein